MSSDESDEYAEQEGKHEMSMDDYEQVDEEEDDHEDENIDDSEDEIEQRLEEEQNAWGTSKHDFYGRDKEADDISSEDDKDELDEAKRLQAIRAKKLLRQQKHQVQESESDSSESEQENEDEKSDKEHSDSDAGFGDKLFGTRIGSKKDDPNKIQLLKLEKLQEIKELIDDMKGIISSLDYQIEFPDTPDVDTSHGLVSFTKLLTLFIKKYACKGNKNQIKKNKKLIDFIKVKEQIVLNY
jgi:hypothetical protein